MEPYLLLYWELGRSERMAVIVGKHINGVVLNPLEYLLDDEGEPLEFETKEAAKCYLKEHGYSEEEFSGLFFEDAEPELSNEHIARIDEIHNAVFEMCKVLVENPDLEWDMSFIGEIADFAADFLCVSGYAVRYPVIVIGEDGSQHIEEYYEPHQEGGESENE